METSQLPEDCIAHIISLTSPKDACKSCLVCPLFRSASESNLVWEKFLPSDYNDLISRSAVAETTLRSMPKKALYFHLCDNPIIHGDGNFSFTFNRSSGKKCFMIGARGLSIIWREISHLRQWIPLPEPRFAEVAELILWWLDIEGKIETKLLSTETTYAAHLVFKLADGRSRFNRFPVQFCINFEGQEHGEGARVVFLAPPRNAPPPLPRDRGDGWKEIEMGEFFNEHGGDGPLLCSLKGAGDYNFKSGLIVEGIEFRPKLGQ